MSNYRDHPAGWDFARQIKNKRPLATRLQLFVLLPPPIASSFSARFLTTNSNYSSETVDLETVTRPSRDIHSETRMLRLSALSTFPNSHPNYLLFERSRDFEKREISSARSLLDPPSTMDDRFLNKGPYDLRDNKSEISDAFSGAGSVVPLR